MPPENHWHRAVSGLRTNSVKDRVEDSFHHGDRRRAYPGGTVIGGNWFILATGIAFF
jgi:hypothetical protein